MAWLTLLRRSKVAAVSISIIGAAILFFMILGVLACQAKPPVRVLYVGSSAIINVETLGEYPTTIVRARLINAGDRSTIWEIRAASGTPQLHALILREGDNSVLLADPDAGAYVVVSPVASNTFRLETGVKYELELFSKADAVPAHVPIYFGTGAAR